MSCVWKKTDQKNAPSLVAKKLAKSCFFRTLFVHQRAPAHSMTVEGPSWSGLPDKNWFFSPFQRQAEGCWLARMHFWDQTRHAKVQWSFVFKIQICRHYLMLVSLASSAETWETKCKQIIQDFKSLDLCPLGTKGSVTLCEACIRIVYQEWKPHQRLWRDDEGHFIWREGCVCQVDLQLRKCTSRRHRWHNGKFK